jgi:hypothetical protein
METNFMIQNDLVCYHWQRAETQPKQDTETRNTTPLNGLGPALALQQVPNRHYQLPIQINTSSKTDDKQKPARSRSYNFSGYYLHIISLISLCYINLVQLRHLNSDYSGYRIRSAL